VELWASGKIEGTPYGSFAKMMNNKRDGESKRSATMHSNIAFDHFSYPTGKEVTELEMPRGKRIVPVTIYADPSRAAVPEFVQKQLMSIKPPDNRTTIYE
jgi:hypothetical protein